MYYIPDVPSRIKFTSPVLRYVLFWFNFKIRNTSLSARYHWGNLPFSHFLIFFRSPFPACNRKKRQRRRTVVESKVRRGRRTAVVPGCRWLREGQTNYPRLNTTMCHQLWPTCWQLLFHIPPLTSVSVPAHIGPYRSAVPTSRRVVMLGSRAQWAMSKSRTIEFDTRTSALKRISRLSGISTLNLLHFLMELFVTELILISRVLALIFIVLRKKFVQFLTCHN